MPAPYARVISRKTCPPHTNTLLQPVDIGRREIDATIQARDGCLLGGLPEPGKAAHTQAIRVMGMIVKGKALAI